MRRLQQEAIKPICNADAERAVLAGLIQHGLDKYYDLQSLIDVNDFHFIENNYCYAAISRLAEKKVKKFDKLLILNEIKNIDAAIIDKYQIVEYLDLITQNSISEETLSNFAKILARVGLKRTLSEKLNIAQNVIQSSADDESILKTFNNVEKTLFDFQSKLLNNQEETIELGNNIDSLLDQLAEKPRVTIGIPTGFTMYDMAIGGGIRGPGVTIIGGRAKSAKTSLGIQISINVALQGIPILYLDTEMNKDDVSIKIISNLSKVDINRVESGGFAKVNDEYKKVEKGKDLFKNIPLFYQNISGYSHGQTISTIRRWLNKNVGFDTYGNLRPCLVVLDYIKTMDLSELGNNQEYQYLGQYLTDLHNFCVPYKLPILAFVQLNRDGIEREDAAAISGSDRILWLCTSFSIIKKKTQEDYVSDPIVFGDRKLIISDCRYGPGLRQGEYINVISNLSQCNMIEGETNLKNKLQKDKSLLNKNNNNEENKIEQEKLTI